MKAAFVIRASAPSEQHGFALPGAVIILFIITLLISAAIGVATQTSKSTTRDDNVKAEIEAAEAGLQVAAYRLTELKPGLVECINAEKVLTSKCESGVESLGNNATFQYWTTLPIPKIVGESCAGKVIELLASITQRCITAEGIVNGVKPGVRLQEVVRNVGGESLFAVKGIVGLSEVKVNGNVKVPVVVGSNEKIIGEGSANFEQGYELCPPKGSFTPPAGAERKHSGVKVHGEEENKLYEKTRKEGPPECPFTAKLTTGHATPAVNEDARIGVLDPLVGGKWNAVTHELTLEGTNELKLGGSKYFFCKLTMPKGSDKLRIAATAKVEIFIGSPSNKEDLCAAGTGLFEIGGGSELINETKNPADLFIQLDKGAKFLLANGSSATLEASLYGPEGEVIIEGGQKFKGGVVANKVHLENGSAIFEWSEETGTLTNGEGVGYLRSAWEQCTAGSGPTEGC
jgi:Tfp pilus assembly protein PilX